ncbi:MAG: amidohydrolase family protein [Gemmatimonadaceae bacterium]|nr:amidohydrolase family protein [Gemmatimonadaceae bacterium]
MALPSFFRLAVTTVALCAATATPLRTQSRPTLSRDVRAFVAVDTPVVVLRHVRIIDGTGAPAREAQSLVIRDRKIAAMGPDARIPTPAGALEIDLTGHSVMPGMVMMHEHLFYPTGNGIYANLSASFPRLYLAGGVTAMRTGGNMNGYGEINTARAIARGDMAGPWIDATAPYVNSPPGLAFTQQTPVVRDAAEARRFVDYWSDQGATSFKAYMQVSRDALGAAITTAHARGLRVTAHLCSVTYAEAAALGIDNLEHGFFASTDFSVDKRPDECKQLPQADLASALDTTRPAMRTLIADLVKKGVALTSTLAIFETFTPSRPLQRGLELLTPQLKTDYERRHANLAGRTSPYTKLFAAGMTAEVAFVRAGGLLTVGTDPTGGGGLVPGYSNQRALELLVEAGFTPLEAIQIGTLNGARYLKRDAEIGSIAVGKQADLVVLSGDPSRQISDIQKVRWVFKEGVGFDPQKLIESVRGKVGLY